MLKFELYTTKNTRNFYQTLNVFFEEKKPPKKYVANATMPELIQAAII